MPITVEFIKQNRAVLQTYCDPLDAAQMNNLKSQMDQEILPAASQKLHIIADFRQVRDLPGTMLSSGTRMLSKAHPNTGVMILITQSAFVARMGEIFSRLAPKHQVKIVSSFAKAEELVDALLTQTK